MSVNYNTVVEEVQAEQFTGSNYDAIAAFVGTGNMSVIGGNLKVFDTPVPASYYVVKNVADGKFREVADSSKLAEKYVPVNP